MTASPSTSPETEVPREAAPSTRIRALDGLRGITIVLVMLNHANGTLWPRSMLDGIPVVRSLFSGGSVTLFFVVGGFIVTRNLLKDREKGRLDGVLFLGRRLVRLWVHLVPLAVVIFLLQWWDPAPVSSMERTTRSLVGMLTFTLNLIPPLESRGDLGHLWYLSVQQQWYLVLPLLVVVLGRFRWLLVTVSAAAIVGVVLWRYHVLATQSWLEATVGTLTRGDGLLLGVLLAAALPWLARRPGWARWALPVAALAGLGLLAVLQQLPDFQYLREWGLVYTLVCGVLVVAIVVTPHAGVTTRVFSVLPLVALGQASLSLFVWHVPVIFAVHRYLGSSPWAVQTTVAVAVIGAIAVVSERYVDGPVRIWLRTHLRPTARTVEEASS